MSASREPSHLREFTVLSNWCQEEAHLALKSKILDQQADEEVQRIDRLSRLSLRSTPEQEESFDSTDSVAAPVAERSPGAPRVSHASQLRACLRCGHSPRASCPAFVLHLYFATMCAVRASSPHVELSSRAHCSKLDI